MFLIFVVFFRTDHQDDNAEFRVGGKIPLNLELIMARAGSGKAGEDKIDLVF